MYIISDTAINCQAFIYQSAKLVDIGMTPDSNDPGGRWSRRGRYKEVKEME
jgi:hypothetical protein